MAIILFDIDGTLVNTGGAGKAAIQDALAAEFQTTANHDIQLSGRTDRGIARSLFQLHGIQESPENWRRFRAAYLERLPQLLPNRSGRVLPGVAELLEQLGARQDVALGLLTGNVREGARIKLEYYRLFHHFAFGGFGDHHHDRNAVAQEALAATPGHLNGQANGRTIWVVGDTPLDVSCARWIGARVAAVATGTHGKEELAALRPDLLLDDLSDIESVVAVLCS